MIRKKVINIFSKHEILSEENFYGFTEKKKIVTYVPEEFADILITEMSKAGAGKIGNYEMCSFRMTGTGTYKPLKNANPFKGEKNKISSEEELRIEMECDAGKLNLVLDVMLKHHPYEEAAYEIYNFLKRDKKSSGILFTLKSSISLQELLKKINKKIIFTRADDEISIDKIAFTNSDADKTLLMSAKIFECDCLITGSNKNYKLYKIS